MTPNRYLKACLLSVAIALAACTTIPPGDPRVMVDSSARSTVSVMHVGYGQTKSGAPTVDLTLRNNRNTAQTVKVSTQWFSEGQSFSSVLSEPRPVSLLPREATTLHEVAPNAKHDSFRIFITKD